MIMVRVGLETSQADIQDDSVFGVEVKFEVGSMLLCSSYIWYGTRQRADLIGRALTKFHETTLLRIVVWILMEISHLWGPKEVELDKVGKFVERVLGDGDLLVVNHHDSPPTFFGDRGPTSWMHITVASPVFATQIVRWRVHTSTNVASDHRLIVTQI